MLLALFGTALTATLSYISSQQAKNARLEIPNVILIHLDNMGHGDLSLTGASGYATPYIDNIAMEGNFLQITTRHKQFPALHVSGCSLDATPTVLGFSGH